MIILMYISNIVKGHSVICHMCTLNLYLQDMELQKLLPGDGSQFNEQKKQCPANCLNFFRRVCISAFNIRGICD